MVPLFFGGWIFALPKTNGANAFWKVGVTSKGKDGIPNIKFQVSHEKKPGWLGFIGDYSVLSSYMGNIINHYIIRIPIKQPV